MKSEKKLILKSISEIMGKNKKNINENFQFDYFMDKHNIRINPGINYMLVIIIRIALFTQASMVNVFIPVRLTSLPQST